MLSVENEAPMPDLTTLKKLANIVETAAKIDYPMLTEKNPFIIELYGLDKMIDQVGNDIISEICSSVNKSKDKLQKNSVAQKENNEKGRKVKTNSSYNRNQSLKFIDEELKKRNLENDNQPIDKKNNETTDDDKKINKLLSYSPIIIKTKKDRVSDSDDSEPENTLKRQRNDSEENEVKRKKIEEPNELALLSDDWEPFTVSNFDLADNFVGNDFVIPKPDGYDFQGFTTATGRAIKISDDAIKEAKERGFDFSE